MNPLYDSRRFDLVTIKRTGKKKTPGFLIFRGIPTVYGTGGVVLATEDGVVAAAGKPNQLEDGYRAVRQGERVKILGRDGVVVIYSNLEKSLVSEGDKVCAGQPIGTTGWARMVYLEFRSRGRRVDGCRHLGIAAEEQRFAPETMDSERLVKEICGIDGDMMAHISLHPNHREFWERISQHLRIEGEE